MGSKRAGGEEMPTARKRAKLLEMPIIPERPGALKISMAGKQAGYAEMPSNAERAVG